MQIIPEAALNQHIAILGKTGKGKTYTAKGIVEGLLAARRQVCVLDPTGAWWGLRLNADGKAKGYDVVLLGGKRGDLPLAERSGAAVARLVTQQRASAVIDTSGFGVGEYTRWFIDFAGTLYTTIREPLHLVIDEAHYFMPQGGGGRMDVDAGKMLHAGNRLMSGGRSLGIRGMMITQRPAKLHKDSLTCADTLIAMGVNAPQDREAVKDWIDGCGDPEQGKAVINSLAQLKKGEGWVWYPEGEYLKRVMFPRIKTYDSSATPTHGAKAGPVVASIDLDEVRASMAEAVREAEANDPKLLRAKIAELQKGQKALATNEADKAEIARLRTENADLRGQAIDAQGKLSRIASMLGEPIMVAPARMNGHAHTPIVRPVPRQPKAVTATPTEGLTRKQQQILDALAWLESIGIDTPRNEQVGAIALIDTSGGYFSNMAGPLSVGGLIERGNGTTRLTDAGRAAARPIEQVASLADYHDVLRERVRNVRTANGKTLAILNAIIDANGNSITTSELGETVGIDPTGGYFSNSIGPLSTLGLIDRRMGVVEPTDVLFPKGLP